MGVVAASKPFVTVEIVEDLRDVAVIHTYSNNDGDITKPYYVIGWHVIGWHIRAPRRCQFSVKFLLEGAQHNRPEWIDWEPGVRVIINADNGRFIWREVEYVDFGQVLVGEMPD